MKEPIRVAQIIGKWVGGGVESVVMNYYRYMDKTKVQFDFICDEDSTRIPYEEIKELGGKVILVPPYQQLNRYIKSMKKVLKEGNYKIVHSHINTLSVFPLYCAKKVGVPVRIAHSHSISSKKEFKRNILKQILRPFSKIFANQYMCCSESTGRWLFGNKAYNAGKVYLMNNAIDVEKFKYDEKIRKTKRKELGIKDDQLVIGHIGRFVTTKNHTFLIDIFNEVHKQEPNSLLLLIGEGPLKDKIQEKVDSLNLTNHVKFLGQRKDVNELYQAMDVFVLPSLYEGFPVVGVEAQASGLLCMFSDSMTKDAKLIDSTTFLSLTKESEFWADTILNKYFKFVRNNTLEKIEAKGYEIHSKMNWLVNYYFELVQELKKDSKKL